MSGPLLRGATHARRVIEEFLSLNLPMQIDLAREQWGLAPELLPHPKKYNSYDPMVASEFPSIGSIVNRTRNYRRNNITPDAEGVYLASYDVQVFVWVMTPKKGQKRYEPEYDAALQVRDDMMGVMKGLFLTTPSMGSNGAARLEEDTLVEDYLSAVQMQGGSWSAGGVINFEMKFDEQVYVERIGTVLTTEVETGILPHDHGVEDD